MRKRLDRLWLLNVGNFRQGRGTTAGRYFITAPTRKAARDGFRARFGSMVETVPIACLGQANRLSLQAHNPGMIKE